MHAVDVHAPVPELVKLKHFFLAVIFTISTAGGLSRFHPLVFTIFLYKTSLKKTGKHLGHPDMLNKWEEDVCNFLCFRNPPQEFRWLSRSSRARDT